MPEVFHSELLGFVVEGIGCLRCFVGFQVLDFYICYDLGASFKLRRELQVGLVIFAKKGVGRG